MAENFRAVIPATAGMTARKHKHLLHKQIAHVKRRRLEFFQPQFVMIAYHLLDLVLGTQDHRNTLMQRLRLYIENALTTRVSRPTYLLDDERYRVNLM